MVATRDLAAGEKIMEETPLLQAETRDLGSDSTLAVLLSQLSNTKLKKFRKLYNAFPERSDVGIVKTNCYGLGCNSSLTGVFEKLSRVNHSCRPNAERWWDPERGVETVYAIRGIAVNEEITVAYTAVAGKTQAARKSLLKRTWSFDCDCECCSLTGSARDLSDKRRQFIGEVDEMVGNHPARKMIPKAKEALECCEKEELFGATMARVCYDGYQLALEIRNLREAQEFINGAHQQYLLGTGPLSENTKKMARYVEAPRSHPAW
jgi:hypothetical protein